MAANPKGPSSDHTASARDFEKMYEGQPPWDIGKPQPAFVAVASNIQGSVLDIGCGTGENALFFAERGCQVLGIDLLANPIAQAKRKANERGIEATFQQHDALKLAELGRQFDVLLDCGLFHVFNDGDRATYVSGLATVSRPGTMLYLQCFSDREPLGEGPRRIAAAELRAAFANGWTIESIEPTRFVVRDDAQSTFSAGGPHALFAIIRRL